ncbi:PCCA [Bugula neritina]|uniref:Propionyl-CoA carboxylase alpha chain, mitochondrial n=1 Tax=Bugula neritina TaxID=10212 RepID=A0A7J7K9M1_BUGNE|nr:PCCA [Bugula neritina]
MKFNMNLRLKGLTVERLTLCLQNRQPQVSPGHGVRLLSTSKSLSFMEKRYWNTVFSQSEPKFSKVLIANRGEIACRVIETCRHLGIKSVAVYSEVDCFAPHVRLADEAVCIGPAPSSQSYLVMENIVEAAKNTGADAVHPGYGFLSENMDFAAKLTENNIVFVGPNSRAIHMLGDKIESKRIAKEANVSIVPGFDGEVQTDDDAVRIANEIGYPVMIKASAGGGGKGMRIAWNDDETRQGFRLSKNEAKSSFGDDRMLIEKYIDKPRHIEFQVMCDQHGNAIYLNERECSIQRRNQKVIEEAPSTFLDPETRAAMGTQATDLARAVGYDSAGTVEFLIDSERNFYFLEMNTRLQVEHPITEMITGVDLVHQMLRVAKGHPLTHTQQDIGITGWAVECRVYAEDPFKGFGLPSVGRLNKYKEPTHVSDKIRCDSGVEEGSEISVYYDSMICKLITHGHDRQDALDTMSDALDQYEIRGVTHNIPLLRDIVQEERFKAGDTTTNYLAEVYPEGFKVGHYLMLSKQLNSSEAMQLAAMAACVRYKQDVRSSSFLNNTRIKTSASLPSKQTFRVDIEGSDGFDVSLSSENDNFQVTIGEEHLKVTDNFNLSQSVLSPQISGDTTHFQLLDSSPTGHIKFRYFGTVFDVSVLTQDFAAMSQYMKEKVVPDFSGVVVAPMPGIVKSVAVSVGDMVSEGSEVCVLEAMKMQNSLTASKTAKVKKVNFKAGDTVGESDVIVELEDLS